MEHKVYVEGVKKNKTQHVGKKRSTPRTRHANVNTLTVQTTQHHCWSLFTGDLVTVLCCESLLLVMCQQEVAADVDKRANKQAKKHVRKNMCT